MPGSLICRHIRWCRAWLTGIPTLCRSRIIGPGIHHKSNPVWRWGTKSIARLPIGRSHFWKVGLPQSETWGTQALSLDVALRNAINEGTNNRPAHVCLRPYHFPGGRSGPWLAEKQERSHSQWLYYSEERGMMQLTRCENMLLTALIS